MTDKVGNFTRPRVLLPLLLALILQLAPFSDPPASLSTESSTPTRNYIVRFLDYRPAEDHRTYLETNLRSRNLWRWIERRNPAAQFPTDFGVVSICDSHREALTGELGRLGRVKDVTADSSYSRTIFMDGSADTDVKKPPGKIFTAMSFEDEGEDVSSPVANASISWRRKLLTEPEVSQDAILRPVQSNCRGSSSKAGWGSLSARAQTLGVGAPAQDSAEHRALELIFSPDRDSEHIFVVLNAESGCSSTLFGFWLNYRRAQVI